MGLYPIDCRFCGRPFVWFSGERSQLCHVCVADPANREFHEHINLPHPTPPSSTLTTSVGPVSISNDGRMVSYQFDITKLRRESKPVSVVGIDSAFPGVDCTIEIRPTTRMSSRGQIVIPEPIRKALDLTEGSEFLVCTDGVLVVMRKLTHEDMGDYKPVVDKVNEIVREHHER